MDLAAAKMIGAGLACSALIGAGVGIGNRVIAQTAATLQEPATGTVVNSGATHVASGVKLDYEQRAIDGTNILQGDQRVYLDPLIAAAPQAGDTLTIGTEVFTVVASRPLSPAGVVVLHDIQVRRA